MTTKAANAQIVVKPDAAAVLKEFGKMVTIIPDADDSDAGINILAQILGMDDVKATNAMWSVEGEKDQMIGNTLVIYGVAKRPSDFDGEGLPFYLDCDVINGSRDNAKLRWTCSATSAVAQIVRATALGQMPIRARVEADKTRAGFTAIHLFIVDTNVDLAPYGL